MTPAYILEHWLNRLGQSAWIVPYDRRQRPHTDPALLTPELTRSVLAQQRLAGLPRPDLHSSA